MKARKVFLVFIAVVAVLVISLSVAVKVMNRNLAALAASPVGKVDASALADGVYHGEYAMAPIRVKLDVQVSGGRIVRIDLLEHRNGQGKPAEVVLAAIVEQQKVDVDSVSGATYSSMALKKAVERALTR